MKVRLVIQVTRFVIRDMGCRIWDLELEIHEIRNNLYHLWKIV